LHHLAGVAFPTDEDIVARTADQDIVAATASMLVSVESHLQSPSLRTGKRLNPGNFITI
jgi:hypothetical protein